MYQVIARKYRPQSFADVVNQDHVKRTLTNALEQGRVGHGYIFSGQRGTGKTTMARILAKCLNCDKGPTAEPCLKCSSCTEIAAGNAMDVVEIDAASNRRIDDIRELRENVRYRPVRDRYKVFIIDEAHQITSDAFNALLKTLEEPPEWVVFVLCTTEPHEIPATIASRCQGFQFRAVEFDKTVERMRWICGEEKIEADEDALIAIALSGDGSIRDALSTLDQAIACFGNKLEARPVRDLLGAVPSDITDRIVNVLRENKPADLMDIIEEVVSEGRHVQHFCGELTRYFRNLLVMKVSGADTRLVAAGPDEKKRLASHLDDFSEEDLTRYLQLLLELYRELQFSSQSRFRLEVGLLKLVYAGRLEPIEKVIAELGGSSSPKAGGSGRGERTAGVAASNVATRAEGVPAEASTPVSAPRVAPQAAAVRPASAVSPPVAPAPLAPAGPSSVAATVAHPEASTQPEKVAPENGAAAASAPAPEASPAPEGLEGDLKSRVLIALHRGDHEHLADAVEHGLLSETDHDVEVRSAADYRTTLEFELAILNDAVSGILGRKVRVRLGDDLGETEVSAIVSRSPDTAAAGERPAPESGAPAPNGSELMERVLADPKVQKIQQLFEGQIREVRNLRGYSS